MKYSIIYATIRPEISEKISIGLIFIDGNNIDIRYSRNKLAALKGLFPSKKYKAFSSIITNLKKNQSIKSENEVNYLSRYSNNMISLSPLTKIDIKPTKNNKELLYKNYVYNGTE